MKRTLAALCLLLCLAPRARAQGDETAARAEMERLSASVVKLFKERKFEDALEPARRALKLGEKTFGDREETVAVALNNLAKVYAATGKAPDAEKLYRRALSIYEKLFAPDDIRVAAILDGLALLEMHAKGDPGRAAALYSRALEIRERALGGEHDEVLESLGNLVMAYSAKGDTARIEPLLRRVVETREKTLAAGDPKLSAALHGYACFLRQTGRGDEAAKLEERAYATLPEKEGNAPIKVSSGVALCRVAKMEMPQHGDILTRGMAGSGAVRVAIVVDEAGKVVSAKVLGGPTEFRSISTQAAARTRFIPLLVRGKPVGFSAVITYDYEGLNRGRDPGVAVY